MFNETWMSNMDELHAVHISAQQEKKITWTRKLSNKVYQFENSSTLTCLLRSIFHMSKEYCQVQSNMRVAFQHARTNREYTAIHSPRKLRTNCQAHKTRQQLTASDNSNIHIGNQPTSWGIGQPPLNNLHEPKAPHAPSGGSKPALQAVHHHSAPSSLFFLSLFPLLPRSFFI